MLCSSSSSSFCCLSPHGCNSFSVLHFCTASTTTLHRQHTHTHDSRPQHKESVHSEGAAGFKGLSTRVGATLFLVLCLQRKQNPIILISVPIILCIHFLHQLSPGFPLCWGSWCHMNIEGQSEKSTVVLGGWQTGSEDITRTLFLKEFPDSW